MLDFLRLIAREKLIVCLLYIVAIILAIVIVLLIVQLLKNAKRIKYAVMVSQINKCEQSSIKEEVLADIMESELDDYTADSFASEKSFCEEEKRTFVRYRKSFLSRLIQSSDSVKKYYISVRNALLSYKKVRSRVSWNFDSINHGRIKLVKLNAHAKSLYFYCSLTFSDLAGKRYYAKDVSNKKKYLYTPLLLKIKSERGLKFALKFITILANKYQLKLADVPKQQTNPEDYLYDTTDNLIDRGLIKVRSKNTNKSFGAVEVSKVEK